MKIIIYAVPPTMIEIAVIEAPDSDVILLQDTVGYTDFIPMIQKIRKTFDIDEIMFFGQYDFNRGLADQLKAFIDSKEEEPHVTLTVYERDDIDD